MTKQIYEGKLKEWIKDEKAAIDPRTIAGRLLAEACDVVAVHFQRTVAAGRLDRGDGGQLAVFFVKRDFSLDVDITHAVAIGAAKILVAEIFSRAL